MHIEKLENNFLYIRDNLYLYVFEFLPNDPYREVIEALFEYEFPDKKVTIHDYYNKGITDSNVLFKCYEVIHKFVRNVLVRFPELTELYYCHYTKSLDYIKLGNIFLRNDPNNKTTLALIKKRYPQDYLRIKNISNGFAFVFFDFDFSIDNINKSFYLIDYLNRYFHNRDC